MSTKPAPFKRGAHYSCFHSKHVHKHVLPLAYKQTRGQHITIRIVFTLYTDKNNPLALSRQQQAAQLTAQYQSAPPSLSCHTTTQDRINSAIHT